MTRAARSLIHLAVFMLAATSLSVGCTTPGSEAKPRPAAPRAATKAVLAPTNFDQLTPTQLEPGLEKTDALMRLFLGHRGLEVERLPLGRFRAQWSEALGGEEIATDSPRFGQAAARMLELTSPDDPDAVLVVPGIAYRVGELVGTNARWDGVKERITYEGLREDLIGVNDGPTRCVSLWIRIFDRSGALVHEGYGGVELPWKYAGRMHDRGWYYAEIVDRDDLFRDPAKIAKGIKIAMDPYIPRKK